MLGATRPVDHCAHCGKPYRQRRPTSRPTPYCGAFCANKARGQWYAQRRADLVADTALIWGTDTPESVVRRLGYAKPRTLVRQLYRADAPMSLIKPIERYFRLDGEDDE